MKMMEYRLRAVVEGTEKVEGLYNMLKSFEALKLSSSNVNETTEAYQRMGQTIERDSQLLKRFITESLSANNSIKIKPELDMAGFTSKLSTMALTVKLRAELDTSTIPVQLASIKAHPLSVPVQLVTSGIPAALSALASQFTTAFKVLVTLDEARIQAELERLHGRLVGSSAFSIKPHLDVSLINAELASLIAHITSSLTFKARLHIDPAQAQAELLAGLRVISTPSFSVKVHLDTTPVAGELAALGNKISTSGPHKVKVGLDTSGLAAESAALHGMVSAAGPVKVKVDLDLSDATAALHVLRSTLTSLIFVDVTQLQHVNSELVTRIADLRALGAGGGGGGGGGGRGGGLPPSISQLQRELQTLQNQYKSGSIGAAQYETELLRIQTAAQAASSGFAMGSRELSALTGVVNKAGAAITALNSVSGQLSREMQTAQSQFRAGTINVTQYEAELRRIQSAAQAATVGLAAGSAELNALNGIITRSGTTLGNLTNAANQTRAAINDLRAQQAQARSDFDSGRITGQQYAAQLNAIQTAARTLAAQTGLSTQQTRELHQVIGQTARELNTLQGRINLTGLSGNIMNAVNAASMLIPALGTVNVLMGGLAAMNVAIMPVLAAVLALAGAGMGAAAAIGQFRETEKYLALTANLSDEAAARINEFKDSIYEMAPAVGVGPGKLAEGLNLVAQSSTDANKWMNILNASAKGVFATGAQMKTVVDGVTTALNVGLADSADVVVDKLFQIVNLGKISFEDVAGQMGRVASMAAMLGINFDELGAVIATATSKGVRAETTMAGLNQMLVNSLKPTQAAKEYAAQFGIELGEAAIKSKGFTGFLREIIEKTGGSSEALSKIFTDIDSLKVLLPLAEDAGVKYTEMLKGMQNSTGMTDKAVERMGRTLDGSKAIFMATAQTALDQIGERLAPVVRDSFNLMTFGVLSFGRVLSGLGNLILGVGKVGWSVFEALGSIIGTVLGASSVAVEEWGRGIASTFKLLGEAKDKIFSGDFNGAKDALARLKDQSLGHVNTMKAAMGSIPATLEQQFAKIGSTTQAGLDQITKGWKQLTTVGKEEAAAWANFQKNVGKSSLEGENVFKPKSNTPTDPFALDKDALARVQQQQQEEEARKKASEALKKQQEALSDLKLKYDLGIISQEQYKSSLQGLIEKYSGLMKGVKAGSEEWRTYGNIIKSARTEIESLAKATDKASESEEKKRARLKKEALERLTKGFEVRVEGLNQKRSQGVISEQEYVDGANKIRGEIEKALQYAPETSSYAKSMRKMFTDLGAEAAKLTEAIQAPFLKLQEARFTLSPSLVTYSYGQGEQGLNTALKGLTGKDHSKDLLAGLQELEQQAPDLARVVGQAYASTITGLQQAAEQAPRITSQAAENTVQEAEQAYATALQQARGNAASVLQVEETFGVRLLTLKKQGVETQYQTEKTALDKRYAELAKTTLDETTLWQQYEVDLKTLTLSRNGSIQQLETQHQDALLAAQNAVLTQQVELTEMGAQTALTVAQSSYAEQVALASGNKALLLDVERQYGFRVVEAQKAVEEVAFNSRKAALDRDLSAGRIGQERYTAELASITAIRNSRLQELDASHQKAVFAAQSAVLDMQSDMATTGAQTLVQQAQATYDEQVSLAKENKALLVQVEQEYGGRLTAALKSEAQNQFEVSKAALVRDLQQKVISQQQYDVKLSSITTTRNNRLQELDRQARERLQTSQTALSEWQVEQAQKLSDSLLQVQISGAESELDALEGQRDQALDNERLSAEERLGLVQSYGQSILSVQKRLLGLRREAEVSAEKSSYEADRKKLQAQGASQDQLQQLLQAHTGKLSNIDSSFRNESLAAERAFQSDLKAAFREAAQSRMELALTDRDLEDGLSRGLAIAALRELAREFEGAGAAGAGALKVITDQLDKLQGSTKKASADWAAFFKSTVSTSGGKPALSDSAAFQSSLNKIGTPEDEASAYSKGYEQYRGKLDEVANRRKDAKDAFSKVSRPAEGAPSAEVDAYQAALDQYNTTVALLDQAEQEVKTKAEAAGQKAQGEFRQQQLDLQQANRVLLAELQLNLGQISDSEYLAVLQADQDYWGKRVKVLEGGGPAMAEAYQDAGKKLLASQKGVEEEVKRQRQKVVSEAETQHGLGKLDDAGYLQVLKNDEAFWSQRVATMEAGGDKTSQAYQMASRELLAAQNKVQEVTASQTGDRQKIQSSKVAGARVNRDLGKIDSTTFMGVLKENVTFWEKETARLEDSAGPASDAYRNAVSNFLDAKEQVDQEALKQQENKVVLSGIQFDLGLISEDDYLAVLQADQGFWEARVDEALKGGGETSQAYIDAARGLEAAQKKLRDTTLQFQDGRDQKAQSKVAGAEAQWSAGLVDSGEYAKALAEYRQYWQGRVKVLEEAGQLETETGLKAIKALKEAQDGEKAGLNQITQSKVKRWEIDLKYGKISQQQYINNLRQEMSGIAKTEDRYLELYDKVLAAEDKLQQQKMNNIRDLLGGFSDVLSVMGGGMEKIGSAITDGFDGATGFLDGLKEFNSGDLLSGIGGMLSGGAGMVTAGINLVTTLIDGFTSAQRGWEASQKEIRDMQKDLHFADINNYASSQYQAGFLGSSFGATYKTVIDEVALEAAKSIGDAFYNGISDGIWDAIGKADFSGMEKSLKTSVGKAVLQGMIDAALKSKVFTDLLSSRIDQWAKAKLTPGLEDDREAASALRDGADQAADLMLDLAKELEPIAREFGLWGTDASTGPDGKEKVYFGNNPNAVGSTAAVWTPLVDSIKEFTYSSSVINQAASVQMEAAKMQLEAAKIYAEGQVVTVYVNQESAPTQTSSPDRYQSSLRARR